jgi:hypothetical protein
MCVSIWKVFGSPVATHGHDLSKNKNLQNEAKIGSTVQEAEILSRNWSKFYPVIHRPRQGLW